MTSFETAYNKTAQVEGGYANNPADNGGETWRGIARNMHPDWKGWEVVNGLRNQPNFPRNLSDDVGLQQLVLAFYKSEFWDALRLGEIEDQPVANELYDTGVNMGTGRAANFLQRSLNALNKNGKLFPDLPLTGTIGNLTLKAFNSLNPADKKITWKMLNCLQGAKYISICETNGSQKVFFRSWASRVFEGI